MIQDANQMEANNPIYLPYISAADFEAFRVLMKDEIAPTFQEWLNRRSERIALYYSTPGIIEVYVNPKDFSAFCSANSRGRDGRALLDFAEMTGKAKR